MPTAAPAAAGAPSTLRAAVIGSPIGHSKSPLLHAAAYRALGIDCSYTAIEVAETALAAFVAGVRRADDWRGLSVTMPLKGGMARLVDHTTEPASVLGVVNTVVVEGHGADRVLTGHNTDVAGVAHAWRPPASCGPSGPPCSVEAVPPPQPSRAWPGSAPPGSRCSSAGRRRPPGSRRSGPRSASG
ncbi:hypothetical protein MN0502_18190 [Arthrobacter sp. MN05-02]|nr:hypothetical protein MN0502_18190 [Arthrobacter sp. MN05-02]